VLCSASMSLPGQVGRPARAAALTRAMAAWPIALLIVVAASGCGDVNAALERLTEARQRAADLYVQFVKAADAGNRAVMADTDNASVTFAHEAEQATQAAQADVAALKPILQALGYSNETRVLEEFDARFAKYRALDRTILDLAVENTNLKAQRLSFGPAQEAAEAFQQSLDGLTPLASADTWRVRALAGGAVANVREIQVLEAPHIAEPDDAAMARIEKRMAAEETAARSALATLGTIAGPSSRPRLAAASAVLDRFVGIHRQILGLSHRNTNVRSLALSLDQKRPLTTECEESLRALQDALAKRGYPSKR
jgi:hypothetical protein